MKITTDIWNEVDKEKRGFLWSYYLQQVDESIRSLKLSPNYKELKNNTIQLKNIVAFMTDFKENNLELSGVDLTQLKLIYTPNISDESLFNRISEIEERYLPQLNKRYQEYLQLKEFLYSVVSIKTVGIEQMYSKEGYLFLKHKNERKIQSYSYFISNYVNENKRTLVKLTPLDQFNYELQYNYIHYKMQLNKRHNYNLNCYLIETEVDLPTQSSFIPIAKGTLSRYLESA
ncbi:MAG: hypothetical protein HKP14_04380 [Bacteroidia bacterium]|nr:hypothetical protein [Bacteroidia bacterium]